MRADSLKHESYSIYKDYSLSEILVEETTYCVANLFKCLCCCIPTSLKNMFDLILSVRVKICLFLQVNAFKTHSTL